MANWAELPVDLLVQIANRVKVIEDFIALRAVCTWWRIAITNANFDMFSPQVPLLMLSDVTNKYREFYSLSKKKVSRGSLPVVRGRHGRPSKGWMCTMTNKREMNLLHPFSGAQIRLPPLKSLLASHGVKKIPKGKIYPFINHAVLSVSPSVTSNYVLMVSIFMKRYYYAFWRPGDLNWTPSNNNNWSNKTTSMAYYKGQFYCVTCQGQLWAFDVSGPSIPQAIVESRFVGWVEGNFQPEKMVYLVETSNALLIVNRNGSDFRINLSKSDTMRQVSNLGDSAIFLSRYEATCINCSEFRGVVKPNHIYFTDDVFGDYKCVKVERYIQTYNLEDRKIELFYRGLSSIYQLTWVTPSFGQGDLTHQHVQTQIKKSCCIFNFFKLIF